MTKQYNLKVLEKPVSLLDSLKEFGLLFRSDFGKLGLALLSVVINSGAQIATPFLIAVAIDKYIITKDLAGLNTILFALAGVYVISAGFSYFQTRLVGRLSQKILFELRRDLFDHLQVLPLAFFNQNSTGDIVARLNNDTDKLNTFLSQSVFQFISSFFTFVGIGLFIFTLNFQLSVVVWVAVVFVVVISQLISVAVTKANKESLAANSEMISFLDENLTNFKALVVFNKQEYLTKQFQIVNQSNYRKNILSQILNGFFNPLYAFAGNIAQVFVLLAGLYLIQRGELTIGLLIGFISYTQKFYSPLRALGNVWGSLQEALAAWARVQTLLKFK